MKHEFGGIFIYVGVDPVSKMIEGLGITDEAGWVITDEPHEDSYSRYLCYR